MGKRNIALGAATLLVMATLSGAGAQTATRPTGTELCVADVGGVTSPRADGTCARGVLTEVANLDGVQALSDRLDADEARITQLEQRPAGTGSHQVDRELPVSSTAGPFNNPVGEPGELCRGAGGAAVGSGLCDTNPGSPGTSRAHLYIASGPGETVLYESGGRAALLIPNPTRLVALSHNFPPGGQPQLHVEVAGWGVATFTASFWAVADGPSQSCHFLGSIS